MTRPIADYGLIGNMLTAALVSRDGCIDWLCTPRFDSPACFAALLGTADNGCWSIQPEQPAPSIRRRYRPGTLVLETVFETAAGEVELIDFMPLPRTDEIVDLVRIVRGRRGCVPMRSRFALRFDYGSIRPWVRQHGNGVRAMAGPTAVYVYSPVRQHGDERGRSCRFTLAPGQSLAFVLTATLSHRLEPDRIEPEAALAQTERWWREWSEACHASGPWREQVLRSALTLKALTYSPTGGMVAAPTTSLPEQSGGVRNWDYRYCWLRDTSLALRALMMVGTTREAVQWRAWLHRAMAGDPADLQIMYGLSGERRLEEYELPWLDGYGGACPVRIGNAAHVQRQMDVYGEVMEAFDYAFRVGVPPDEDAWRMQRELMRFVERYWRCPGTGLWEQRKGEEHFTFSKVMCWVAADRAVRAVERHGMDGPIEQWRKLREAIHGDVCTHGFDATRNSFVQVYGAQQLDASLLQLAPLGFLPGDDPRVVGTVEAIQRELVVDGFVQRYRHDQTDDGLPGDEGSFIACTFWLADALCTLGRREEALRTFERALGACNDLGLLAEEYDAGAERLLGNFPQAFSHLALINSARMLQER
jgi:GH15 family glucan-1,4-alpha-glucosidase